MHVRQSRAEREHTDALSVGHHQRVETYIERIGAAFDLLDRWRDILRVPGVRAYGLETERARRRSSPAREIRDSKVNSVRLRAIGAAASISIDRLAQQADQVGVPSIEADLRARYELLEIDLDHCGILKLLSASHASSNGGDHDRLGFDGAGGP